MRLTQHKNIMDRHEPLLNDFPMERLDATRHIGRAVAVRAVIDFEFRNRSIKKFVKQHLETVETEDNPILKKHANAAIARHLQAEPAWDKAHDTWRALKKGALSDASLLSWERACNVQSILRR
jgi:type II secretory pathway predicted ATPase ExeA